MSIRNYYFPIQLRTDSQSYKTREIGFLYDTSFTYNQQYTTAGYCMYRYKSLTNGFKVMVLNFAARLGVLDIPTIGENIHF